ncbi:MAG: ACT domain-containing protein [Spartobacteria bacterium]|nr:ACT domain-containing protein [Spartobacteria bacterium]
MKKVLIPTKLSAVARELLERNGNYTVVQNDEKPLDVLAGEHGDAYALIVRSEKVTPEIMDQMGALKVIIRAGSGFNTIDTKYARSRGIDVMNTPGANANAVAEEVVALMLADARHIVAADPSVRAGKWEKKKFMGRELSGKTIGIVGLGYIGRMLAKRLEGFEMKALGYDPVISEERARDCGIEMAPMEDLFARSDYISLHIPENDETRGMINAALLSTMKKGATLVNCARAGIVNEDDVRRAVAEQGIRYLNDVYAKDAEGEKSVADFAHVMLPHLGASTEESNINAARRAAEQLIDYDEKGISSFVVNRDIPEGLDEKFGDLAFTLAKLCRSVVGGQHQLRGVETSIYGTLKPYAEWLLVPVLAALSEDFDRSMDFKAAQRYLADMGIEYENRETDSSKGFKNSITVDLTGSVDADNLRHASVRGTVAEGCLMIARINDFDKLYIDPKGHLVVFSYKDRPGVLGQIAAALADADINIDDVRNPHDSKGSKSIALLKVNKPVDRQVVQNIAAQIEAELAFHVEL